MNNILLMYNCLFYLNYCFNSSHIWAYCFVSMFQTLFHIAETWRQRKVPPSHFQMVVVQLSRTKFFLKQPVTPSFTWVLLENFLPLELYQNTWYHSWLFAMYVEWNSQLLWVILIFILRIKVCDSRCSLYVHICSLFTIVSSTIIIGHQHNKRQKGH